jgi:hypothetical protein
MHFKLEVAERDLPVRVYGSVDSDTENILDRLERRRDFKFSKERSLLLQSSLKTGIRNLLGGRGNLSIVVSVEFLPKDLLGWFDLGDIFSDAGSNQSILKPAIGSLNLSFRLRGEGVSHFDVAILQDLFPLGRSFIGQKMVCSPEGIPSLDEPKDGMAIDIIGVREAVVKGHGLKS